MPGEAESLGVPERPGVGLPLGAGEGLREGDGEAEPEPDREGEGEGFGDPLPGDGDADCGDGEPDCGEGELDWGGGLAEPPVGGGGDCGGWLRKMRMAMSTPSAASSIVSSHETRMLRHPARS
jgi:hypothetical protein